MMERYKSQCHKVVRDRSITRFEARETGFGTLFGTHFSTDRMHIIFACFDNTPNSLRDESNDHRFARQLHGTVKSVDHFPGTELRTVSFGISSHFISAFSVAIPFFSSQAFISSAFFLPYTRRE